MNLKPLLLVMAALIMNNNVHAENLRELISKNQIQNRIIQIAHQLDQEYQDQELILVMVMKGAICLVADLMREIKNPCSLEYIKASSYGQNGTQAGTLTLNGIENLSLHGKHVIIVDDIFDTGHTMTEIKKELLKQEPASLKTLVLLLKNKARSIMDLPDYALFTIEDEFVIGYGLDYKELYRGLPGIYIFEN